MLYCLLKRVMGLLLVMGMLGAASGCSVGMAMSGKRNPELAAVHSGASRGEIEMQLGPPVEIMEVEGKRVDTYEYETGNEPSAGRAIGHGVMDILTLGLWEVVGTPVEGFQGDKKYLRVEYDENDIAARIGTTSGRVKQTATPKTAEAKKDHFK